MKANRALEVGHVGRIDQVLRRFEERLARLESEVEAGARHWKAVHLHKALAALPGDHLAADQHLDELDRAELAREYPEMAQAQAPTVAEIRSRFGMIAGGML
jgi:hypothetical protein